MGRHYKVGQTLLQSGAIIIVKWNNGHYKVGRLWQILQSGAIVKSGLIVIVKYGNRYLKVG